MTNSHSDALVFFGATDGLAYKKLFPSLQAMVKRGHLNVPVIGVAKAGWNIDRFRARVFDRVEKRGSVDRAAFDKLSSLLRCVAPAKGRSLSSIPPVLFAHVVEQRGKLCCACDARVILEKPFGIDLASARKLNDVLLGMFPESSVLSRASEIH